MSNLFFSKDLVRSDKHFDVYEITNSKNIVVGHITKSKMEKDIRLNTTNFGSTIAYTSEILSFMKLLKKGE